MNGLKSLLLDPEHKSVAAVLLTASENGPSAGIQALSEFLSEMDALSDTWAADPLFAAAREEARQLRVCLPVVDLAAALAKEDVERARQALVEIVEKACELQFLPGAVRAYLLHQVYESMAARDPELRALRDRALQLVPEGAGETDDAWSEVERQVHSQVEAGRYVDAVDDLVTKTSIESPESDAVQFNALLVDRVIEMATWIADQAVKAGDAEGEYVALDGWVTAISQRYPAESMVDSAVQYAEARESRRRDQALAKVCRYTDLSLLPEAEGQQGLESARMIYQQLDRFSEARDAPMLRTVLDNDVRELLPYLCFEADIQPPPRYGEDSAWMPVVDDLRYAALLQPVWISFDSVDFDHAFTFDVSPDLDLVAEQMADVTGPLGVEVGVARFRTPHHGETQLVLCYPQDSAWTLYEVAIGFELASVMGRLQPRALSLWQLDGHAVKLDRLLRGRDQDDLFPRLGSFRVQLMDFMNGILQQASQNEILQPASQGVVCNPFMSKWSEVSDERKRSRKRDSTSMDDLVHRSGNSDAIGAESHWLDDD